MKCALCNASFNDGVQCGSCKKQLDFGCANITEVGWKKLGADRRAAWKCPSCRITSPSTSTTEQVSLQVILNEIRDLKRQLSTLPSLKDDVHSIKEELKELRTCCEHNARLVEDFSHKIKELESRIIGLEGLQATVHTLHCDVEGIRAELIASDQRSRLNNVEIKGVPLNKSENLFNIVESISRKVNFSFPMSQINYISRIPMYKSKEKTIIVSFLNRYIKEDFVAAARACKTLSTLDLGFQGTSTRIYVNDHLNADSKTLLNKTKLLARQNNYKYVWVKHGKIHFDIHPMLLTIQVDMRDSRKINTAVVGGFAVTGFMFIVTTLLVATRYGLSIDNNILQTIPPSIPLYVIALLVTLQLSLSSAVGNSALFQHIEHLLKIPRNFCVQRCLVRSSIIVLAVFLGESVPRFDLVMGLVGSTLTGPLMFIFPPLIFLRLCYIKSVKDANVDLSNYLKNSVKPNGIPNGIQNGVPNGRQTWPLIKEALETKYNTFTSTYVEIHPRKYDGYSIKWYDVLLALIVMAMGICATIVATYSSWADTIAYAEFSPPCLINATIAARSFLKISSPIL